MNEAKVVKTETKAAKARVLFAEIFTRGYKLPEGKTQRAHFIERAIAEFEMTSHGAATYYQNLTNASRGQPMYKYNRTKPKGKKTAADVAKAEEMVLALVHQATERWMCVNETGYEVNSFKTRSAAQEFAKGNGLKWKDRQAA